MIDADIDAGEFVLRPSPAIGSNLEAAIESAMSFMADDAKGGRRADDRTLTFVRYLAGLYRSEVGVAPTYTIDPAAREGAYVQQKHGLSRIERLIHAIIEAIKDACERT